jgi:hypothetical protein
MFATDTMKATLFWDVMPCSLIDYYQIFRRKPAAYIFRVEERILYLGG